MTSYEEIKNELSKARGDYEKAEKGLEEFMKEENLEKFEKRWGTEELGREKERLEESKKRAEERRDSWDELYRKELSKGEGNEQIA